MARVLICYYTYTSTYACTVAGTCMCIPIEHATSTTLLLGCVTYLFISTGCTEILQKVLVRPEFSTRLLQNLVTKKESKTTHILFLLEQMPRSITTRVVPIQHLFDASQVNVLNVINKEDIDKNLLQKLTECGMVIECVHLEKAIEVLPDRENTLPVLDFLIDHTHAQSDQLTPVCHKSIQSQKTLISSHLIKHGARPLPSEVMSLVESSAKFYPVFIVHIAQSDICEKAYRTKLFKISCEQMKNSPDYSDTALKVLKSGPIDTTDIDLGTLFKSSAELLHSPLLIKQLLEAGVSAESSLAVHPLTLVMRYKEIDCETRNAIVCMLLEKGASCEHLKVSSPGTTSLHVATKLALETSMLKSQSGQFIHPFIHSFIHSSIHPFINASIYPSIATPLMHSKADVNELHKQHHDEK